MTHSSYLFKLTWPWLATAHWGSVTSQVLPLLSYLSDSATGTTGRHQNSCLHQCPHFSTKGDEHTTDANSIIEFPIHDIAGRNITIAGRKFHSWWCLNEYLLVNYLLLYHLTHSLIADILLALCSIPSCQSPFHSIDSSSPKTIAGMPLFTYLLTITIYFWQSLVWIFIRMKDILLRAMNSFLSFTRAQLFQNECYRLD